MDETTVVRTSPQVLARTQLGLARRRDTYIEEAPVRGEPRYQGSHTDGRKIVFESNRGPGMRFDAILVADRDGTMSGT